MKVEVGSPHMRIGEAARLSGVSVANIRFYEEKNLLSASSRSDGSYRLYSKKDIHTLRFIRLCRAMDMSLDEVQGLIRLDLQNKADCAAASEAIDAHLRHVRERLAELKALEKDLKTMQLLCDGQHDTCGLIEALHARAEGLPLPKGKQARRHV